MNSLDIFLNIILPILSIAVPVFATVYTVNKRIKSQTRENHQPHVVLEKIRTIDSIDKYKYYFVLFGRNYNAVHENIDDILKLEEDSILNVEFLLKNIGYGVATNIKFYNLLTGMQVYGSQRSSADQNQQLYTTLDIADGEQKKISAQIVFSIDEKDGIVREDHNRILCVYKDLNNNVDSFIITINVKQNKHYDYFAYQPSSLSYKKWIKENKKNYKKIINKYINL